MKTSIRLHFSCLLLAVLLVPVWSASGGEDAYDPLSVPVVNASEPVDLVVHDRSRHREIPVRVYLPLRKQPAPVVLFSHGLGGSREGSPFLGHHWAARGYVAVFLQHPGSDTAVWKGKHAEKRMAAMRRAASAENYLLRVKDVSAVLDQLALWNGQEGHALSGRLDMTRVGMSGHSFGAVTTQAVSGQVAGRGRGTFRGFTDPRIKAAVILSPSSPRRGSAKQAFARVAIPWMLMTGTKDLAFVANIDMKSRLAVFPALPEGGKYEVVLYNAEHSAFTDRALPGDREKRNPNHHRVILALSTAFWDVWLRDDMAAKVWLDGGGPSAILDAQDTWRRK
ncbi:MAG: dienelactone hydrolase [Lentisphaeria bacterium]|nr:dienelactone hydrolase [Lentisphaeria bacterium]